MNTWILLNVALKGTIVLGAAWLLTLLLRRKSAAARHLVWTAASAAVLALPMLSIGLPELRLPAPVAAGGFVFRVFSTVAADAPAPAPQVVSPASPATGHSRPVRLTGALPWIWSIGAAVVLLQMLGAYAAMWRKRRRAPRFDSRGVDVDRGVELLAAEVGSMPMVFGVLRPAIFLPADAADWSDDRLRLVVEHELAHVRRGDLATHVLARTALALHWWNPLAWMAWREFVKERERAADDLVLHGGTRASDYAGHLLAVAQSMQSGPATAWAAVAMARRSQLEGRLVAILDDSVSRGKASRLAPVVAALLAVAMVAPFAALRAQESATPPIDAAIRAATELKNPEILDAGARAFIDRFQYDKAQTLLEAAQTIRAEVAGQQSAVYAAGLVKLGDLAVKRRQYGEADLFYAKAVSLGDRPEVAPALLYLGIKAHREKNPAAAEEFFERTLRVAPKGPIAGQAYTWQAIMRENQPDAETLFQSAISVMELNTPELATTLELYSRFLRAQQRDADADQAVALAREVRRAFEAIVSSSTSAVRMSESVEAPALTGKVEPEYSPEARAAKYQGTVRLNIDVTPEGKADNIRVARSLGLGLDEKAVEAVRQWTFRPGRDKATGEALRVSAVIEVNFRLM